MIAPALTFRAEDHTYWLGSRRIPGVTTILKPLYDFSMIPPEVLRAKGDLGTAVHLCCELFDEDNLDESSVLDDWRPYVDAWARFVTQAKFIVTEIEQKVFHPGLFYAGQLDRIGYLDGEPVILDIKTTSTMSAAVGCQLIAYEEARKADPDYSGPEKYKRIAVQLKPDGKFAMHEYKEKMDWPTFVSLLTIHQWKQKHGVKE
jgi:hypothetical protein